MTLHVYERGIEIISVFIHLEDSFYINLEEVLFSETSSHEEGIGSVNLLILHNVLNHFIQQFPIHSNTGRYHWIIRISTFLDRNENTSPDDSKS